MLIIKLVSIMIYFPLLEMVMHLKMQLNTRLLLHNMERERVAFVNVVNVFQESH